jgi:hypothetical protein
MSKDCLYVFEAKHQYLPSIQSNVFPTATTILLNPLCPLKVVHSTRNSENHSFWSVSQSYSMLYLGERLPAVHSRDQTSALHSLVDLIDEFQGKGDGELCAEASQLNRGFIPKIPFRDHDDNFV